MSSELSKRIQELLRRRLGVIGFAPDLRNDDPAIEQVCRDLGLTREVVANELDGMRIREAVQLMGRDRIAPEVFGLKPAMRRAMASAQLANAVPARSAPHERTKSA